MLKKLMGRLGEEIVKEYLKEEKEYEIIGSNIRIGNIGEIDIIAKDKDTYVFIEVRTRKNNNFMNIHESVGKRKKNALYKAAQSYILNNKLQDKEFRIDLATYNKEKDQIKYYKNIIEDTFR